MRSAAGAVAPQNSVESPGTASLRHTPWLVAERFVQTNFGVTPMPVMLRLSAALPV
jgi:hypothetical protein